MRGTSAQPAVLPSTLGYSLCVCSLLTAIRSVLTGAKCAQLCWAWNSQCLSPAHRASAGSSSWTPDCTNRRRVVADAMKNPRPVSHVEPGPPRWVAGVLVSLPPTRLQAILYLVCRYSLMKQDFGSKGRWELGIHNPEGKTQRQEGLEKKCWDLSAPEMPVSLDMRVLRCGCHEFRVVDSQ